MTLSGWARLRIVTSAAALASCPPVTIIEDPYRAMVVPNPDACVLDIRVSPEGRTIWKGEEISDEEFDRRLREGRTDEACIEQKNLRSESP